MPPKSFSPTCDWIGDQVCNLNWRWGCLSPPSLFVLLAGLNSHYLLAGDCICAGSWYGCILEIIWSAATSILWEPNQPKLLQTDGKKIMQSLSEGNYLTDFFFLLSSLLQTTFEVWKRSICKLALKISKLGKSLWIFATQDENLVKHWM